MSTCQVACFHRSSGGVWAREKSEYREIRDRRHTPESCVRSVPPGSLYLLSFLLRVRKPGLKGPAADLGVRYKSPGEEGPGCPNILSGKGHLFPRGARWAGRNHGSRFSIFKTAECPMTIKY